MQRAERVSDAFGLVFVLVMVTYVLASLLENRGWTSVVLTVATSATSVVALTSSHARTRTVRVALVLSVLTVLLAAIGAAADNHDWLNLATLIQVSLLTAAMGAVLRRVVMAPEVGSRTILGALSVYVIPIPGSGIIEFRQPCLQYRRGRSCGFQLAQSNPDSGAALAVQRGGEVRRRLAGSDRIDNAAFDRKKLRKPKTLEHPLKRIVACGAASVARRMLGV